MIHFSAILSMSVFYILMKITFLGTGAAEGIPCFGCECPCCQAAREKNDRNSRRRSCFLIQNDTQAILVDTPPDISRQLDASRIHELSAILLSHEHYDHAGGLTEFEYWVDAVIHVFAGFEVLSNLRLPPRFREKALLSPFFSHSPLYFGAIQITPFKVLHTADTYGFSIYNAENKKKVVYFSDSNRHLGYYHRYLLKNADILILHTPRFASKGEGDDHLSVEDVVELARIHEMKRVILTHINHRNRLYAELVEYLQPYPNIIVGYDRMVLEV